MRICFALLLIGLSLMGYAQSANPDIDVSRIPQQKIRFLLENQMDENSGLIGEGFQPTYRRGQTIQGYHRLTSAYVFRESTDIVWHTYQATSPAISWNGSMVSFGLLVSKWNNQVLYNGDQAFSGIDTGQVIFVNLRILKGLYNLAVGLRIVDIDETRKSITYSYIKGGKSRGEQTLYFMPTKKGNTQIVHQTAFKGDSYIRDRYFYPYFHRIAINEFHRNMKRCIRDSNKMLANK